MEIRIFSGENFFEKSFPRTLFQKLPNNMGLPACRERVLIKIKPHRGKVRYWGDEAARRSLSAGVFIAVILLPRTDFVEKYLDKSPKLL
ncbi:MAG: hypothetical protein ACI3YK_04045 [Eubacteriales bacterium]